MEEYKLLLKKYRKFQINMLKLVYNIVHLHAKVFVVKMRCVE